MISHLQLLTAIYRSRRFFRVAITLSSHFNVLHEYFAGISYCADVAQLSCKSWTKDWWLSRVCVASMKQLYIREELPCERETRNTKDRCRSCEKFSMWKYLQSHLNRKYRENFYTVNSTMATASTSPLVKCPDPNSQGMARHGVCKNTKNCNKTRKKKGLLTVQVKKK